MQDVGLHVGLVLAEARELMRSAACFLLGDERVGDFFWNAPAEREQTRKHPEPRAPRADEDAVFGPADEGPLRGSQTVDGGHRGRDQPPARGTEILLAALFRMDEPGVAV